jgi:hypothetical protein
MIAESVQAAEGQRMKPLPPPLPYDVCHGAVGPIYKADGRKLPDCYTMPGRDHIHERPK